MRSTIVCARNSVSSKTVASGQKVTVVPVRGSPVARSLGAGPVAVTLRLTLPPFSNSASQCWPSRSTSSSEPGREGVDDGDPHAVEPARDLVALAAELAAGVEGGQDDLGRRDLGVLRVGTHRDPRPSSLDPAPAVGQEGHVDPGAVPGHGLVDRVVDDLPDQVVQTGRTGGADVHPGPFAHRLEPLEDGDVGLGVGSSGPTWSLVHLYCHRRALSEHRSSRCVSNPRTVPFRPFDANTPFYPTDVSIRHS